MSDWNLAEIWERLAARVPDRPCQIKGDRVVTWSEFDRRAEAMAADFQSIGLSRQGKVACYLYNGPEYMETMFASFKVSAVPVNVNFRYAAPEVHYLLDNADVEAVVFDEAFLPVVEEIRADMPQVKRWYVVGDAHPEWAMNYEDVISVGNTLDRSVLDRSGDDILLMYTGGTTGMPKGVMWRQDDLVGATGSGSNMALGLPPAQSLDELVERVDPDLPWTSRIVASPLMHGAGQFTAILTLNSGGTVVSLQEKSFEPEELVETIQRHRVTALSIVGLAFGAPLADYLDAHRGEFDLSSVRMVTSSGVMWPQENKQRLLSHLPNATLLDAYGSSEAIGVGRSVSNADDTARTAVFEIGPSCAVFNDAGERVAPGSEEIGKLAIGGRLPLGYYKDPDKTAEVFPTLAGQRWSMPGDYATVNADGTVHLLGRGSSCINTGGEKVYPEEVEEVLRQHDLVRDVVVIGVPDDRFGEAVCAVVETPDGEVPTLEELVALARDSLAPYKAPRHLVTLDSIQRGPNGKIDFQMIRSLATEKLS